MVITHRDERVHYLESPEQLDHASLPRITQAFENLQFVFPGDTLHSALSLFFSPLSFFLPFPPPHTGS